MTSGIPGSAYQPHRDTEIRLRRWRELATAGVHMDAIAARCGMSHRALDQMLLRARRAGHRDAVPHANAPSWTRTWRTQTEGTDR